MEVPYILSLVTYFPALIAVILLLIPRGMERAMKTVAFAGSLLTFLFSLHLVFHFDSTLSGMQFTESVSWIKAGQLSIQHHLGIDGISLFLVILTTFLTPLTLLSSWHSITKKIRIFLACMLFLETGMIGVFCALDLALFYVFWEVMLIPMYFLIGVWGGERRIYAAVKFVLYTMTGSLLMLVAILYLLFIQGGTSFDLIRLTQQLSAGALQLSSREEFWLFAAFFLAFAIKVPLFPFHTWLPDAHVEAPTAGSVILAGVLLKMGTYGLLRFCLPLFPDTAVRLAPVVSILAVIGIIYGALVAMVQPDLKKLVAYSSVSHMGLIVLGIFSFTTQGLQGSVVQMLNHGLSTGALFLLVGFLYDRRHTRKIAEFGGLAHIVPIYASIFLFVTLSSIGLPGLNGFVGEVLLLMGSFARNKITGSLAALSMVLGAVYMLWMYQRVFLGKAENPANQYIGDINTRERLLIFPILLLMLWIGVFPMPFLNRMEPSIQRIRNRIEHVQQHQGSYYVKQMSILGSGSEQTK
jgi:NADH-quinone oxidoreductase subunit M